MLEVKRTETIHYIAGEELACRRDAVVPKLIQRELASKLTSMTRQAVTQQLISDWERPGHWFGVNDEMLAALNGVLG